MIFSLSSLVYFFVINVAVGSHGAGSDGGRCRCHGGLLLLGRDGRRRLSVGGRRFVAHIADGRAE